MNHHESPITIKRHSFSHRLTDHDTMTSPDFGEPLEILELDVRAMAFQQSIPLVRHQSRKRWVENTRPLGKPFLKDTGGLGKDMHPT
jgi:hypothetical protein